MAKKSLIGNINAGYKVIRQGEVAVLAENEIRINGKLQKQYVAWSYSEKENGITDFYWGRYGELEYATSCFEKKENGLYSGD